MSAKVKLGIMIHEGFVHVIASTFDPDNLVTTIVLHEIEPVAKFECAGHYLNFRVPQAAVDVEPVAYQYWTVGEFWKETSLLGYQARRDAGEKVRALFTDPPTHNLENT